MKYIINKSLVKDSKILYRGECSNPGDDVWGLCLGGDTVRTPMYIDTETAEWRWRCEDVMICQPTLIEVVCSVCWRLDIEHQASSVLSALNCWIGSSLECHLYMLWPELQGQLFMRATSGHKLACRQRKDGTEVVTLDEPHYIWSVHDKQDWSESRPRGTPYNTAVYWWPLSSLTYSTCSTG